MGILLLPVLLVLFLAGNARTEEESSLTGDADLHSNLKPVAEKVAVREPREAGKKDLKKKKLKKGNGGGKDADRIQKRKQSRKLKKQDKMKTPKQGKKKNKKPNKKKNKNEDRKKKTRKNKKKKEKKEKKKKRKEKKRTRKDKKKKKKLSKKKKKNGVKSEGRQAAGGDWSSCGTTGVNDTCLLNAVNALNFEKGQIQNFFKQKARLENQNKVTGNKKGKKNKFEDAAGYMLTAIGGNISTPTCGDNSSRTQRAAADAVATYNTLINCSASIHEACDMPNGTINATFNANCAKIYNLSKIASDDCRSNSNYTSDGAAACNCWEKAAIGITIAKEAGCTVESKKQAQAVKKQKNQGNKQQDLNKKKP